MYKALFKKIYTIDGIYRMIEIQSLAAQSPRSHNTNGTHRHILPEITQAEHTHTNKTKVGEQPPLLQN